MARDRYDDEYDDDPADDPRPRRRRAADPEAARGRVATPGLFLVLAGLVMMLFWVANVGILVSGYDVAVPMMEWMGQFVPAGPQKVKFDQDLEEMKTRDRTGERVQGVVFGLMNLAANVVVILGGLRMRALRSHGLAMTGSILAMIPVNSCCCVGLPVGLWALLVLNDADVKAAFRANAGRPARFADDDLRDDDR